MKQTSSVSRRVLAQLLVLGIALTVAPPASAADSSQPTAPLATSIAHAARTLALATPDGSARATEQAKPGDELAGSSAFFRQPLGIAILATLAVGSGYALYSLSRDRIRSVARQGQ